MSSSGCEAPRRKEKFDATANSKYISGAVAFHEHIIYFYTHECGEGLTLLWTRVLTRFCSKAGRPSLFLGPLRRQGYGKKQPQADTNVGAGRVDS
jgi:hypothetical protein